MIPPSRQPLTGGRWHVQHGPIDLVIGADGEEGAVEAAHAAAWARFQSVLGELVAELPVLRRPVEAAGHCPLAGVVARRMWLACRPLAQAFVTPMAAVAGAVAEEIIAAYRRPGIARAWVNNGGDIAIHLAAGQSLRCGVFGDLARAAARLAGAPPPPLDARFEITATSPVRGIATSGWRGRSCSLGIADSVTVLAAGAAAADAAATLIANAVNVDDPRVIRQPASSLKDDSDLGDRLVTVHVPPLPAPLIEQALANGVHLAHTLQRRGLIHDALLLCQGQVAHLSAGAVTPALAA